MTTLEIIIIAIVEAMDCFAVAISTGLCKSGIAGLVAAYNVFFFVHSFLLSASEPMRKFAYIISTVSLDSCRK